MIDFAGYESPITLITKEMHRNFAERTDALVYEAVTQVGVVVDKDELVKALRYDRGQYDLGYRSGYSCRDAELVRCKDCKHSADMNEMEKSIYPNAKRMCIHCLSMRPVRDCDYCAWGERRTENDDG